MPPVRKIRESVANEHPVPSRIRRPTLKSYMWILTSCPEPVIDTTLSECCVSMAELCWSLQKELGQSQLTVYV